MQMQPLDHTRAALLFGPYPFDNSHHGARRLRRFAAWLMDAGWTIRSVSAAGCTSQLIQTCAIVPDPLGVWRGKKGDGAAPKLGGIASLSQGRRWSRWMIPDSSIGWAVRCMTSVAVHRLMWSTDVVISSSPPESPHLAASLLCRLHRRSHIVDMRDGWLDEPLKSQLSTSQLRRVVEGVLESWVLKGAAAILVTSPEWKSELIRRFPEFAAKTHVIYNSVPAPSAEHDSLNRTDTDCWLYCGRFGGSRTSQSPIALLNALRIAAARADHPIDFRFVGTLDESENRLLDALAADISASKCTVTRTGPIPHEKISEEMFRSKAFLMLCCAQNAIPSKLFEYAAAKRPIMAVCRRNSASWHACQHIPQALLVDCDNVHQASSFNDFIKKAEYLPATDFLSAEAARRSLTSVVATLANEGPSAQR
jgi:hypothetical protein